MGYEITSLIAGSVVIEKSLLTQVSEKLFIDSIVQDYAVITSLTLILGLATLIGTLLSDIIMSIVDPESESSRRINVSERKSVKTRKYPTYGITNDFREFLKDKIAIFSLVLLVAVLLFVFIGSAVIDQSQVMHVSILDKYAAPGAVSPNGGTYLLGADEGGRDVWGQLIIGARNSILIVFHHDHYIDRRSWLGDHFRLLWRVD